MSAEEDRIRSIVAGIAAEAVDGAMRDGSTVAFDMSIALARDIARRPELSPQQADVLNGFASALRTGADEFLSRIPSTPPAPNPESETKR